MTDNDTTETGRSISHMCDRCEDSGVIPPGDFAGGETCPVCNGYPANEVPHDERPHPPDYDCPDCSGDSSE